MNQVTKTQESQVPVKAHSLGIASELTSSDIQIGRIAIAQAMSEVVKNEQAKIGDIYNTSTLEVLGHKKDTPLDFFPLYMKKYWVHKDGDDFLGITPNAVTPKDFPWTDGTKKNFFTYSYFVLLASDIKEGVPMPMQLAFQSSNIKAAKQLNAFAMKLDRKQLPSWGHVYTLGAVLQNKDKHSWWGADISLGKKASKEELEECEEWYHQLKSQDDAVNESIADMEEKAAQAESDYVSEQTDF